MLACINSSQPHNNPIRRAYIPIWEEEAEALRSKITSPRSTASEAGVKPWSFSSQACILPSRLHCLSSHRALCGPGSSPKTRACCAHLPEPRGSPEARCWGAYGPKSHQGPAVLPSASPRSHPLQQEQDSRPFQAHGCTTNNCLAVKPEMTPRQELSD